MNIIKQLETVKELSTAKDMNFKVGDIVEIEEIDDDDDGYIDYCDRKGIVPGATMKITLIRSKDTTSCDADEKVVCNEVCKDKCITMTMVDDESAVTHSCYCKIKKI